MEKQLSFEKFLEIKKEIVGNINGQHGYLEVWGGETDENTGSSMTITTTSTLIS